MPFISCTTYHLINPSPIHRLIYPTKFPFFFSWQIYQIIRRQPKQQFISLFISIRNRNKSLFLTLYNHI